jgi:putative nucleotidyltransferase with HDIG domain
VPPLSRQNALDLVHAWTQSPSLRTHMLAVEAAMRAYAARFGEDPDHWGLAGLLHDFDYERYPNADQRPDVEHPAEGVRHLRTLGYPDDICDAILGHARYTGVARETRLARTLFAVDELCGLVTATALVRPSRSVLDVDVKSVQKKFKDKAFARGVSRDDIVDGAAELGVPLEEHIGVVIAALQGVAGDLGLAGPPSA